MKMIERIVVAGNFETFGRVDRSMPGKIRLSKSMVKKIKQLRDREPNRAAGFISIEPLSSGIAGYHELIPTEDDAIFALGPLVKVSS